MKKRVILGALAISFGASSARANPDPVAPTVLSSSDTLRAITFDLVAACGLSGQLSALGGGSSLAGQRMSPALFPPNGMQQVAPQSRFMNSTECNAVGPNLGQGVQIGLDGIAAFHDDSESSPCRVLRYAGCMPLQDLNNRTVLGFGNGVAGIDDGTGALLGTSGNAAVPLVNGQYCFTHWADALRIIFTGQHAHLDNSSAAAACNPAVATASAIADRRCNSDVRRTLVETWANMFDSEGDDGAGGCDDFYCLRLKHAWRRDDFSGTTDVFLALIGAPGVGSGFNVRTFCNGLENEDLDPIRRPCSTNATASNDPEAVCAPIPFANRNAPFGPDGSPSAAPGSTPATPPASTALADLGLVLPISLPQDLAVQYDNNFCAPSSFGGAFKFAQMPTVALPAGQKCPDGNNRVAGQCRAPVYSSGANVGKFNCRTRRTNRAGGAVWANYDARAYNLVPRDPATGAILQPNSTSIGDARWGGGGHYRIHMAFSEPSQTPEVFEGEHPTCQLLDATTQIGCLVQADACSIGFAGLEAEDQDANDADSAVPGANLPFLLRVPFDTNTSEINSDDLEIEPRITTIHRLTQVSGSACVGGGGEYDIRYPLARLLWFNASKGFGGFPSAFPNISNMVDSDPDINATNPSVNGPALPDGVADLLTREKDLAVCFTNRTMMDPILENHGFIPLPTAGSYPDSSRFRQCP